MPSEIMTNEIVQPEIREFEGTPSVVAPAEPLEHAPLFPAGDTENFRNRWRDIQGTFVDEPRHSVEKANQLVETVIQRLTDGFAQERVLLEKEWGAGKDVSTEDLRQALRRYRSFFDRLLSV
jgi:hypothetical protein